MHRINPGLVKRSPASYVERMAESEVTREELIARCANGEHAALRELYDRSAAQLFGVLTRILVREDLAQEALQDVFVRVWRNAASYRASKGSALTWMISIARYRALDIRRHRSHEVSVGDATEYLATDVEVAETDLVEAMQLEADVKLLRNCLDELSVMQRNSVSLAYLNGLTHPEISTVLDAPIGTVKSWVRRGLASLKECVER